MKLQFRISKAMDYYKVSKLGLPEQLVVRVPQTLRTKINIPLGYTPAFMAADGSIISLIVIPARYEDLDYPDSVCVTSSVARVLGINDGDIKEVILQDEITLGCDPEFFLVDMEQGYLHRASAFFSKWDNVGCDGIMAELRPFPSTSEHVVANNLYNLIKEARLLVNTHQTNMGHKIAFIGSSTYNNISAGFHLHYGIPLNMLGQSSSGSPKKKMIDLMIKAMDFYIGIPSIIAEGEQDSFRRVHPFINYGKPGEYRIDTRTLEYRVPGGALLKHPILAKGILALGAVMVEDIVSRFRECTNSFFDLSQISSNNDLITLYPNIPTTQEIFGSICSVSTDKAKGFIDTIRSDVEKMVAYKRRAVVINEFFDCIMNSAIYLSNNIEGNWREYYHAEETRQMEFC